jgi:endogenous inhibitor of DNA gyrase (YacG/DUF329 family)
MRESLSHLLFLQYVCASALTGTPSLSRMRCINIPWIPIKKRRMRPNFNENAHTHIRVWVIGKTANMDDKIIKCLNCQKVKTKTRRNHKFCSARCRANYWTREKKRNGIRYNLVPDNSNRMGCSILNGKEVF